MCWNCGHPEHEKECQCDRTTYADGIEIDGPCGCTELKQLNPSKE